MVAQLSGFTKNRWIVYLQQVAFVVCRRYLNKAVRETKGLSPSHTLRGSQFLKKHKTKRSCVRGGGNCKGSPAAVVVVNSVPAWDADKETEPRPLFLDFKVFRVNMEPAGPCLLCTGNGLKSPCTNPRGEHFSWAPVTSSRSSQAWEVSLHL